jgi:hypothetical protein
MISALAILAITFVTCRRKTFSNQQFQKLPLFKNKETHNYVRQVLSAKMPEITI